MKHSSLTQKLSWAVFWVFVLLFSGYQAYAEELKMGYINSIRIRAEYKEFSDAQGKFDKEIAEYQNQDTQMRQEIDSLQKVLESQSLLLSEAKRKEKEQQLDQKKQTYRKFFDEVWGPKEKVKKKKAELTKPILDKINAVLERIANQDGYAFIFDAVNGNIAYARKTYDITDRVLSELNK